MSSYLEILLKSKANSGDAAAAVASSSNNTNQHSTSISSIVVTSSALAPPQQKQNPSSSSLTGETTKTTNANENGNAETTNLVNNNIDERVRGIEKRQREKDFDDSKCKPWSERWTREQRGKRKGSCTRTLPHGNSQGSSYCCRGY